MTQSSYYIFPNEVRFGFGQIEQLGNALRTEGVKHACVLADQGVVRAGLAEPALKAIAAAGIGVTLHDKVLPNPDASSVDAAAALYRKAKADAIVGFGGGSALDTAKAMRIVVGGPRTAQISDYAYRLGSKAQPHPKSMPFFVAIPTTAGTGAEVTPWAVITDPRDKVKFGVGGVRGVPDLALVDPGLMMSMPASITAGTGMDALTHLIEAYSSTNHNPMLDAMALDGIAQAGRWLPVAVTQPGNHAAREAMAHAAIIGGIAISSMYLGVCHSVAHQLSGFANIPHGLANAIMLPHVMAYNLPGCVERYARINTALGGDTHGTLRQQAERAVEAVKQLLTDTGLPTRLRDAAVPEDVIPQMATAAYHADTNWMTNPRTCSEATMDALYRAAY
jgi:alcohol dehydrogenase class IV